MGGLVHLIIDVQNRYFNPGDLTQVFAAAGDPGTAAQDKKLRHALHGQQVAQDINKFAAICHENGIPNIYIMHRSNPSDSAHEDALYAQDKAATAPVVIKKGFDAFFGTDLKETLDQMGADTVILSGGILGACVYETGMSAIQAGLRTLVARDLVLPDYFDFEDEGFKYSEMEDWGMTITQSAAIDVRNQGGKPAPTSPDLDLPSPAGQGLNPRKRL